MVKLTALTIALALLAANACAACSGLHVAYVDQHRPPYYLGNGNAVPEPPGASVELLREIAASVSCPLTISRMPLRRLRTQLAAGAFDAMAMEVIGNEADKYALPLDQHGKPDKARALRLVTVVFVRAEDRLARDTDPVEYFRERTLGTTLGSPYAPQLRAAGMHIDEGAIDLERNLEKLRLHRVDGVLASLTEEDDLDKVVASRFGTDVVRLTKPLRENAIWLSFNKTWYAQHTAEAEAMWQWIAENGPAHMRRLGRKYGAGP